MSPTLDGDDEDLTRAQQTKVLSVEFLITMGLQTIVFIIMGTMAYSTVEARVKALESQQVTDARIARIEEKLGNVLENQTDTKDALRGLQNELRAQRRD